VALKTLVTATAAILAVAFVRVFSGAGFSVDGTSNQALIEAIGWTLNNKIFLVGLALYSLVAIRKILYRIQDIDVD
jgi:4-hydroxybenzoate polyprenyltransferase